MGPKRTRSERNFPVSKPEKRPEYQSDSNDSPHDHDDDGDFEMKDANNSGEDVHSASSGSDYEERNKSKKPRQDTSAPRRAAEDKTSDPSASKAGITAVAAKTNTDAADDLDLDMDGKMDKIFHAIDKKTNTKSRVLLRKSMSVGELRLPPGLGPPLPPSPMPDRSDGRVWYWALTAYSERIFDGKAAGNSIGRLNCLATESGGKPIPWDGVRSWPSVEYLRHMKVGDLCLVIHPHLRHPLPHGAVGVVKVVKEHSGDQSALDKDSAYYDAPYTPTIINNRQGWLRVHVLPEKTFSKSVELWRLRHLQRDDGPLANMELLNHPLMPVSRVSEDEWSVIMSMAEKPALDDLRGGYFLPRTPEEMTRDIELYELWVIKQATLQVPEVPAEEKLAKRREVLNQAIETLAARYRERKSDMAGGMSIQRQADLQLIYKEKEKDEAERKRLCAQEDLDAMEVDQGKGVDRGKEEWHPNQMERPLYLASFEHGGTPHYKETM